MAQLFASPFYTGQDNAGRPMSFARWYFYETGTLDPATVFADAALSVPLGAVVTADSAGRFPAIYLDDEQAYRAVLMEAGQPPLPVGVAIRDIDPLNPAEAESADSPIVGGFKSVQELLEDDNVVIGYSGEGAQYAVEVGDIITAGGFRYQVAASVATDAHVTTAGGVKLYALSTDVRAFGVTGDGSSADNAALETAFAAGALDMGGLTVRADTLADLPIIDPRRMENGTIDTFGSIDMDRPTLTRLEQAKLSDARSLVESEFWPHAGGWGEYAGAMDGCIFRGFEYYFVQSGSRHNQAGNTGGNSGIIAYRRNPDGSWTTQPIIAAVAPEDLYLGGVSVTQDGQRILLFVSVANSPASTRHGGRVYVLQRADSLGALSIASGPHSTGIDVDAMVPYGKPLASPPSGQILVTMYGLTGGAILYRSSGNYASPGTFTLVTELFPVVSPQGFPGVSSEVDIGYWGNMLVAVCRRQTGDTSHPPTYRITYDLSGLTGWQPEQQVTGFPHIWLRLPQYTPASQPLIISATHFNRTRAVFATLSAPSTVWSVKESVNLGFNGSPTIVHTSRGYGIFEYQDVGPYGSIDSKTRIFHHYLRPDHATEDLTQLEWLLSDLSYLRQDSIVEGRALSGNCQAFNSISDPGTHPNGWTAWIKPRRAITVTAVYMTLLKTDAGLNGAPVINILDASDNLVASGSAGVVVQGDPATAIRCPITQVSLSAGVAYKIRLSAASSADLRICYNSHPLNRTTFLGSTFELLGVGTSVASLGQMPTIALEAR